MKIILSLFAFFYTLVAGVISLYPTLESPFGVLIAKNTLYVSNQGNKGFINSYKLSGELIKKGLVKGLTHPAGMAFKDGVLYVADGTTIKGFDENGEKVYEFYLSNASRLSDLLFKDNNVLLACDEENGNIFEIEVKEKKYRLFATLDASFGSPKAMLIYDGKLLLANSSPQNSASLGFYNLEGDRSFIKLGDKKGSFSGIVIDDKGYLLVSVHGKPGSIEELNFKAKLLKTLPLSDLLAPSQLAFKNGILYVPLKGSSKLLMFNTH